MVEVQAQHGALKHNMNFTISTTSLDWGITTTDNYWRKTGFLLNHVCHYLKLFNLGVKILFLVILFQHFCWFFLKCPESKLGPKVQIQEYLKAVYAFIKIRLKEYIEYMLPHS